MSAHSTAATRAARADRRPRPAARGLPGWHEDCLLDLIAALDGVQLTDDDRDLLAWLAGWGDETTERVARLLDRTRTAGPPQQASA